MFRRKKHSLLSRQIKIHTMGKSSTRYFRMRQKTKRRKLTKTIELFAFVVFIAVISFGLAAATKEIHKFLFLSGKFNINRIIVNGLQTITENDFISKLPVKYQDNLISTYFVNLEKKIKNRLPEIKQARIKRILPYTIEFTVVERTPIAWFENNGIFYSVDDENISFDMKVSTDSLPQIIVEDTVSVENTVSEGSGNIQQSAVRFLKLLKVKNQGLYFQILKLYNKNESLVIRLKDNIEIFWGDNDTSPSESDTFDIKLKFLVETLNDAKARFVDIEYIDLGLYSAGRIIVKQGGDKKRNG